MALFLNIVNFFLEPLYVPLFAEFSIREQKRISGTERSGQLALLYLKQLALSQILLESLPAGPTRLEMQPKLPRPCS